MSARGRFASVALAVVGIGLPLLALGLIHGRLVLASPDASVSKKPQLSTLYIADRTLTLNEEVSGIPEGSGLGAFSIGFFYPRNLIQVTVEEGPFLGSTGRTTSCFTSLGESFIGFHCLSGGLAPGPTGSGILAYIHVSPQSAIIRSPTAGNGALAVVDDQAWATTLADVLGDPIELGHVGDAAIVLQALEGDLNLDCAVDVLDEQSISFRYYAHEGSLFYQQWYDLEPMLGDGDIDIKDLQFVYGRYGRRCEPLEPTPTPTPSPTATSTPTATTAATSTPTATAAATSTPTAAVTSTPTAVGTYTPTATAAATGTPTAVGTYTPTATSAATGTPTAVVTSTPSATATRTPISGTPTATATGAATRTPTVTGTSTVPRTPTPTGTSRAPTPAGTGTPSAGLIATATPGALIGPIYATPEPGTPSSTQTPVSGALPAATSPARVLPGAGGGPTEGWPVHMAMAAGILVGVGVALLLLSLRSRPTDRGP